MLKLVLVDVLGSTESVFLTFETHSVFHHPGPGSFFWFISPVTQIALLSFFLNHSIAFIDIMHLRSRSSRFHFR